MQWTPKRQTRPKIQFPNRKSTIFAYWASLGVPLGRLRGSRGLSWRHGSRLERRLQPLGALLAPGRRNPTKKHRENDAPSPHALSRSRSQATGPRARG
eukprot:297041-Pyramimonas_sp.AAC.1